MLGRVWSGIPIAAAIGRTFAVALDPTRSLRVYLANGFNQTMDSAEMWEQPATGLMHNTKTLAGALPNTLVAASTPCLGVTIQVRASVAGVAIGGSTVPVPPTGGIVIPTGASYTVPGNIDDLIKIYINGTIGDIVDFTYTTR